MSTIFKHKLLNLVFLILVSFITTLGFMSNPFQNFPPQTDSGVFLYMGRLINQGKMPYLDGFDHKGPLLYLINAAGYRIAPVHGIWFIELITLFLTFYFIYRCVRLRTDDKVISYSVVILCAIAFARFSEGGNLTEEYAMPFIAASLYIFLDFFLNDSVTVPRLLVLGFSCAAVFLLRVNMCTAWAVFCLLILFQCLIKKQFKELGKYFLYFFIGFALMLMPVALWLKFNGAFEAFIESYFIFNLRYSSAASTSAKIETMLGFYENPVICTAFIACACDALMKKSRASLIYLFYFAVSLALISMSGYAFNHYGMILIPALGYPYTIIFCQLSETVSERKMLLKVIVCVLIGLSLRDIAYTASRMRKSYAVHSRETAEELADVIRKNSEDDDLISVNGNFDSLYVLTDRNSASKYSYQSPIGTFAPAILDEYYQELESNVPRIIITAADNPDFERMQAFTADHEYQLIYRSEQEDNSGFYIYKKD